MATSITPVRSLKEQYLMCKGMMTRSGLDNDDLIVWGESLGVEDGNLDKALRRSSSTRFQVQRCLVAIESELTTEVDLTGAGSEDKAIGDDIEALDSRLEIRASVAEYIQQLTSLSSILADPVPSDDLKRMTSASMADTFTQFDIKHITDKFPSASLKLQRRLGIINRLRRWRIRDQRIAHRATAKEHGRAQWFPSLGSSEVVENFEVLSLSDDGASSPTMSDFWEDASDSGPARPSSVSSASVSKDRLFTPINFQIQSRQPKAPLSQQRPDLECAICFKNIGSYLSEQQWMEHVFEDLEPYVCTVGTCAQSFCTFALREDWMNHEFTEHHSQDSWSCHQCAQDFNSSVEFREHMKGNHSGTFLDHQLDSIVAFSKDTKHRRNFGVRCPLCQVPLKNLAEADAQHIGKHLEDISLFILQSSTDIFDGDEGLDEVDISATQGQTDFPPGAGSLVTAFSRCIESFRIAITAVEIDHDIELLATQLSFQRMRFALWGEAVGLVLGSSDQAGTYNAYLYQPDIRPKLESRLSTLDSQLRRLGQPSLEVRTEFLDQSRGLNVFAEAYNRVYSVISNTVEPFSLETRIWSNLEIRKLSRIIHFSTQIMDSLEITTGSFMTLEKLHDELRTAVQAILEPSLLVLIKDAAIELPGDSTGQHIISNTAARCLEYVQFHGTQALDLNLQDRSYGRALSVIKVEEVEYSHMEYGNFQHDAADSPNLLAANRILTELRNIWTGHVPFINVQLVGTNIDKLLASIEGPPGTPYAGGVFWITVQMPTQDPFGLPRLKFHTRIYHPNIDVRGNICADNPASWEKVFSAGYVRKSSKSDEAQSQQSEKSRAKPTASTSQNLRSSFQTWTLSGLLIAVCGLLASPNIHEPLVPEIARQYIDHYDWYCETAKSVTLRYAGTDRPPIDTLVFPKGSNVPYKQNSTID